MSIRQRIKSAWKALTNKGGCGCDNGCDNGCGGKCADRSSDAELAADEVIEKEVYPPEKAKKPSAKAKKQSLKKRTRPTNANYTMIDPSDDTFDASES